MLETTDRVLKKTGCAQNTEKYIWGPVFTRVTQKKNATKGPGRGSGTPSGTAREEKRGRSGRRSLQNSSTPGETNSRLGGEWVLID